MPDFGQAPSPEELQFEHAEPIAAQPEARGPQCLVCHSSAGETYYHAQGQIVCHDCADRIQSGQQAPPAFSLLPAALYGAGAALAGCLLYAFVAIAFSLEIGILAILVGWMVGKAIRHASKGRGGRSQQILAVLLTYFSISTSYVVVMIYQVVQNPSIVQKQKTNDGTPKDGEIKSAEDRPAAGALVFSLLLLAGAAPFMGLTQGISGIISLFIMFIGLQRAWRMTGRTDIVITGPYTAEAAATAQ